MNRTARPNIPGFIMALALLLAVVVNFAQAQPVTTNKIRVQDVQLSAKIRAHTQWFTSAGSPADLVQIPSLAFKDTLPLTVTRRVTPSLVQKNIYLRFNVENLADSAISFYFMPGNYFDSIEIFKSSNAFNQPEKVRPLQGEPMGFRRLTLDARQSSIFYARLHFVKTTTNFLDPSLIRDYYLDAFNTSNQNKSKYMNIMTYVFTGILLVMIFYSLAVYLLNNNIEFVYYSGYAFCLGLMLFLKSFLFRSPSHFNYFFEAYLDFIMQSVGTLIYLSFLRIFIDTRRNFPFLNKMLIGEQLFMIVSLVAFSFLYFSTDNYVLQSAIENVTKYVWSLGTVIFIIYTFFARSKLLNYLAAGHFFLLLGGIFSLYMMQSSPVTRRSLPEVLNNSLFYYELGLTIELFFFLAALAYKNKRDIVERTREGERLKIRNEKQELEKQLAVFSAKQEERNRISADMHDELGSGVTAIRLMSEIVKAKMKEHTLPEIFRISNSANDLINKMNTLIWTMKSENDSLESLVAYIRSYALEFFENTPVQCVFEIPANLPDVELTGEKRRNLFLSVKESLTNILKHARADKVSITFYIDSTLVISIADNGVGIGHHTLRQFGNGLKNIQKRMEGIEGVYAIKKNVPRGTISSFELNI